MSEFALFRVHLLEVVGFSMFLIVQFHLSYVLSFGLVNNS